MTLPRGWTVAPLLDVLDIHDHRRVPLNQAQRAAMPGDYPYYGANGQVDTVGDYLFDGDFILLAEDGGFFDQPGRPVAYEAAGKFWVNNHAHIISAQEGVSQPYLAKLLNSIDWLPFVSGTTRLKLTQGGMQRASVPLPPTAEQRRIVAKLDVLTTSITRTRGELDRVPALAARLRASALRNTFAVQAAQEPLSRLSEFVTSGSRGWAKYYSSAGAAFIRVGDVRRGHIGLDLTELQRVEPPSGAEGVRTALLPGDVVVTITADLGRVGLVPEGLGPAFVNQHVALVRISDTGLSEWIAWYLTSAEGQRQMLAKDRGVTKAGLGLDDIRNVTVPIPASSERQARIKALEATFARADRLEAEAACARALLDRLESALLAKAFRGELVPQDPEDEPASELLERIRARRAAAPKAKRGRRARAMADA